MNVLIVEDEQSLANEIREFLSANYHCDVVYDASSASEKIFLTQYDFILVDLGLPDYDGFKLLKEIKEAGQEASVIIITARNETDDRVKGLKEGADDYLAKPFSLFELQARMQAITRRRSGLVNNVIEFGEFKMDTDNRKLYCGDNEIKLTKKEFDILEYLLLYRNRVITRLQLTEHIWGNLFEDDYDSNYVDVHIKNIRNKLGKHGAVDWLETVRGVGYRTTI